MTAFEKPRIVISKCIEFDHCRYNGEMLSSDVVKMLKDWVEFIPVCPEVEIGLGVPRKTIRLVSVTNEIRLMQPETGRDVTQLMQEFSDQYLASLKDIDGFILKSRSPSCGLSEVKLYADIEKSPALSKKQSGFFGGAVLQRFSDAAIEDEGRLLNFQIRDRFLTHIYTLAAFRKLKSNPSMSGLVAFHASNKYLFMAYNESLLRAMGRVVANLSKHDIPTVFHEYEALLSKMFTKFARSSATINTLMHCLGYFSEHLSSTEKAFFLDTLQKYREKRICPSVPAHILKSWIVRFGNEYLATQRLFEPYPEIFITVTDSGKGRDL